jgi:polyketide biosynthesis 3-hydroxy-3-methylglutaryl-CoA synthase-like enzyme PksG
MTGSVSYGIETLNVYAGQVAISAEQVARGRGLDATRLDNVGQTWRSVGLGCEDPVTNAVNAAKPIVDSLGDDAQRIELVVVSSESGVDYSKSLASYVHRHLGLSARCRFLEVKQACYAATGMLQLAVGFLSSGMSPDAKVLLIASDVALVDARAGFSEVSTGFGAVALLLGDAPALLRIDRGAYGLHSYEVADSSRPLPTMDIADVDRSLFAYLDCLSGSFAHYCERVEGADFLSSFGLVAMHTPFPGIVRAAHRKMMRESGHGDPDGVAADFARRAAPSLVYPERVGNLCSGSLYLGLASAVENRTGEGEERIGLFSYGSGCASEFFSGVIGADAREALRPFAIGEAIERRTVIDFATYEGLLEETGQILVARESRETDIDACRRFLPENRRPMLVLEGATGFYRRYRWI